MWTCRACWSLLIAYILSLPGYLINGSIRKKHSMAFLLETERTHLARARHTRGATADRRSISTWARCRWYPPRTEYRRDGSENAHRRVFGNRASRSTL